MFGITYASAKSIKVDCLSDYERRELDCWIAENIEQHCVRHNVKGIKPGSLIRLSDLAYREFQFTHKDWKPTPAAGPYRVSRYSFSPAVALNVFQTTEYSKGWIFIRENEEWHGTNDGLHIRHCKSLALCLMLVLQHEYTFQNRETDNGSRQDA